MSLDLEHALRDMARSVHDDDLAERMNGQVYRMVAQVRRRRAARTTATGVVGLSAAAAVVVGGAHLAEGDGDRTAPVATDAPDAAWPACGDPAPAATEAQDLVLAAQIPGAAPYGDPVPLRLNLTNLMSMSVTSYSDVNVAVAQDGVVVGTAQVAPVAFGLTPGTDATETGVAVTACGGDSPLGDGDYTLVAGVRLDLADGTTRAAISAAAPFTISVADEGKGDAADTAAQDPAAHDPAARAAMLTDLLDNAARSAADFPVCGSAVPPDADAPVALELALPDSAYDAGATFSTPVTVRATTALSADARLTADEPVVVLTRDGVVVGRAAPGGDAPEIALGADGAGAVDAVAQFALCSLPGADAAAASLPVGDYQAYAAFTLTVDDPALDIKQSAPWEPVVVRSAPVEVTLR